MNDTENKKNHSDLYQQLRRKVNKYSEAAYISDKRPLCATWPGEELKHNQCKFYYRYGVVDVNVLTSGIGGGLDGEHIVEIIFDHHRCPGGFKIQSIDSCGIRITANGDCEALALQKTFQHFADVFTKHGLCEDLYHE